MTGIDDSVAMIGDWVPPSPSPRAFFSALLGDDISTRSILESPEENKSEGHFMGSQEQMTSGSPDNKDAALRGDQMTQLGSLSEQKSSSRGGLVERMAARAGFNAPRLNTENIRSTDLSPEAEVWSPYLTIPPGLSPTTLLDSPVFLSNSSAQPSPTTGKFPFTTNGNKSSIMIPEATHKSKENFFEDVNTSSFAFKPPAESGSSFFFASMSKVHPATLQQQFSSIDVSFHSANSLQCNGGPAKVQSQNGNNVHLPADLSRLSSEKDDRGNTLTTDQRVFDNVGSSAEHSPPLDEQHDEGDQRASGDSMLASSGGAPSEDGYNWRKYGQKQVKGSEYPRSYYKCTYPNCQVKKKVERSHEGHITEIIYKGAHNHPKPPPNRRSVIGSSNPLTDLQPEAPDQTGPQSNADNDPVWASTQRGTTGGTPDWRQDNVEVTSASIGPEFGNPSTSLQAQNRNHFESGDAVDASSTFSNDEDEDDRGTHGSVSLGYDGEGDESESKRRKIETYATEMSGATRAIREPRVVVQTTSEVDILDDGYRWRKYGQKVVKGNPNPRSYYKCTNAGCTVRKHVERASHDLKSVITTYEGKHNHVVPAARNSSHVNSGNSNSVPAQAGAVQAHVHRPEPSQVHNMSRFERPASLGSFSLPGRQQMGTSPGFSFVMNQPGLANLGMAGLGPGQSKLPVLPVRSYMASQHQVNDMGFMLPKGEPKVEPVLDPGMNLSTNSALYQQLMSRLPLGPQM
ncbi:WRKY transcription factor 2 isoform X1 [Tripterygium wilfordii]|uniref:WRKY transcription factor 2 isoform X1 n=1 Tax=Tripterygium wilfordii TaxID=458696 RepID=A0A7J7C188_TRIWF|nr:probable WRKY transcription factor 2 isoform X1 [Tripterygium wilfordii]KAF5727868.1 WRKY transcription factor 2 isoform X1 [Tripterygium wilfordii]